MKVEEKTTGKCQSKEEEDPGTEVKEIWPTLFQVAAEERVHHLRLTAGQYYLQPPE